MSNPYPIKVILIDIIESLRNIFLVLTRPIWYSVATNNIRVQTDTNSTILTYQYYVYPSATTQGSTSVWSQQGTDGINMARTAWAVNVRSNIS